MPQSHVQTVDENQHRFGYSSNRMNRNKTSGQPLTTLVDDPIIAAKANQTPQYSIRGVMRALHQVPRQQKRGHARPLDESGGGTRS